MSESAPAKNVLGEEIVTARSVSWRMLMILGAVMVLFLCLAYGLLIDLFFAGIDVRPLSFFL
jgi:hypothetical protein